MVVQLFTHTENKYYVYVKGFFIQDNEDLKKGNNGSVTDNDFISED